MELNEKIFEKARQIAMEYPMPPDSITESDARAMMENASIQLVTWTLLKGSFVDWETLRANTAMNVLTGLCANTAMDSISTNTLVEEAIYAAGKLIEKLKEKENRNEKAV